VDTASGTAELGAILAGVRVDSPWQFTFGEQAVTLPEAAGAPAPPLALALREYLYHYSYCRAFTGGIAPQPPPAPADEGFVEALRAANAGADRLDAGWRMIGALPSGQIVAQREGAARALWPGEFVAPETPGNPPRPGAAISLFLPRESRTLQPGFYFAFGGAAGDGLDEARRLRFYWHVRADGAPRLVAALTSALQRFQVPFRFKCLAGRAYYDRRDAAILYVGRRHYHLVAALLVDIHAQVAADLEPDTPLFCKRLAPGLALAEDPGPAESFGQHRCRLLAEGLWQAYETGCASAEARLGAVTAHFAAQGIPIDRAHLNAGTTDDYPFPP
jgi:hypothetical protein